MWWHVLVARVLEDRISGIIGHILFQITREWLLRSDL